MKYGAVAIFHHDEGGGPSNSISDKTSQNLTQTETVDRGNKTGEIQTGSMRCFNFLVMIQYNGHAKINTGETGRRPQTVSLSITSDNCLQIYSSLCTDGDTENSREAHLRHAI